ncbi:Vacuolar protein sorting/targeting protein 10 [Thelohanellus kitauei]|uniref:Vacuolar protein sorting/targeting protein 10 n=1 Tax=Thelohanellus kitauei TaxID=669202 RepID=A0A0C2JAB5_THEKT|nr:Vacuolar protein sorting/targeting protein 10 [Thelohanellus kitauei]
MKHENNNSECVDGLCDALLHLQCESKHKVDFHDEWFITLYGIDNTYSKFQIFSSFDGGKIWKTVPLIDFGYNTLNRGGIFIGLNKQFNKLIYSLDKGNTYYHLSIHDYDETIVFAAKLGVDKNERFIIYGHNFDKSVFMITQVDFTNIFSN